MAITVPIVTTFNGKGISDFGNKIGEVSKKAAVALSAIGIAAVTGAAKAVSLASDYAESQAKIGEIFGASAVAVEAFAATAATSLGQSKQDVLNAAGTFGVFGDAAGLGGQDLVDFSNNFTTLASDLASFNNTSPQEAVEAIGSALRGESEPLRKYGVMLDDAALKAEAMAQGIYNGKGPLTQQQKILASTALIFKKTTKAQGDFDRTSGGLANQTRIMKAQLANAATTIGTALLPIALRLSNLFATKVIPIVQKLSDTFSKKGLYGVLDLVKGQLPRLQEAFSTLWNWITTVGVPKFVKLMQSLGKALVDWIGPRIMPMLKKLGELIGKAANWIFNVGLPLLVDKIKLWGDALVAWITPLIGPMLKKLGDLLKIVANWILTVGAPKLVEASVKLAQALIGWASQITGPLLKGLAVMLLDIGKWVFTDGIPALARLGVQLGAGLIDALVSALKGLGTAGLDIGKSFANAIIGFVNSNVIDSINNLLQFTIDPPGPGPTLTINPPDLPHIPKLAAGGIVNKRGGILAMIGEAGPEAVIPLNRSGGMGGMGNTITINVQGADPQAVVRALQDYNRTAGPIPVNTRAN